eukprot:gnl/TRDRNA2_/TRDRNA2_204028_c0_seq1.p1 gnl/TRDRNA2_/TRDRNA2_204028_c0~~gnl/TRDRNA2_/TRDRNA2_204028_c0_seq1.p1  ORF type:complete len:106 (-),score=16.65 gnl/TRDRNA2_/TRDRNA2_204028_c0_seq1:846-1163(-)
MLPRMATVILLSCLLLVTFMLTVEAQEDSPATVAPTEDPSKDADSFSEQDEEDEEPLPPGTITGRRLERVLRLSPILIVLCCCCAGGCGVGYYFHKKRKKEVVVT